MEFRKPFTNDDLIWVKTNVLDDDVLVLVQIDFLGEEGLPHMSTTEMYFDVIQKIGF